MNFIFMFDIFSIFKMLELKKNLKEDIILYLLYFSLKYLIISIMIIIVIMLMIVKNLFKFISFEVCIFHLMLALECPIAGIKIIIYET